MSLRWWFELATLPFSVGGAGVALFFVVSGYCIHRSQRAYPVGLFPIFPYLRRRGVRIYPVLVAAMGLTWLLDSLVLHRIPTDPKLGDHSLVSFLGNLTALQGLSVPPYGSNGPLWSIAVELQLYVVYIALAAILRRWGVFALLGISLITTIVCQITLAYLAFDYVFFGPYLFTWSVGVAIAHKQPEMRAPRPSLHKAALICGAVLLAPGLALLHRHYTFLAWDVLGVAFGLLVSQAVMANKSAVFRTYIARTCAMVGGFSYSLYAIHLPLLVFIRAYWLNGHPSTRIEVAFLGSLICVAAAWLFYLLFERWSAQPSKFGRFNDRRDLSLPTEQTTSGAR
ncbi:MAG: acyltransferase [Polyangiaceae bacterium]